VPRSATAGCLATVEGLLGRQGAVAADLCSGVIHFAFTAGAQQSASLLEAARDEARRLGGALMIWEQAGAESGDFASWGRDEDQLALMRRLKAALDPLGLMNPALMARVPG
jgi:FAD/FMN-containing dehydrogenase